MLFQVILMLLSFIFDIVYEHIAKLNFSKIKGFNFINMFLHLICDLFLLPLIYINVKNLNEIALQNGRRAWLFFFINI